MSLVYGSVCSGIEAATVAWDPLGWRPAFFSEIEPFARAVLTHHYAEVPLHGDFTTIEQGQYEPIDLLVGGTPCQDFSVAGLRAGLAGKRGQLTVEFVNLLERLRPSWFVWENVPGVLSADGGRAFGTFLKALADSGYSCSWRVLDAQYFGVAQRRRRVFVVGHLGDDWRPPAAVLLEPHGSERNPRTQRAAGQVAPTLFASGAGTDRVASEADFLVQESFADVAAPLLSMTGGPRTTDVETQTLVPSGALLRRLTPVECERLQGFPDNYTLVTYREKPAKDSPRYRALGNSFAVPVVRWIGERIAAVQAE